MSMITKAEDERRTMRALFVQAGIIHEDMVQCVREALGDRVAKKAVEDVAVNPRTGLKRPRAAGKAMKDAIFGKG